MFSLKRGRIILDGKRRSRNFPLWKRAETAKFQ
jgi:hypothetical protein